MLPFFLGSLDERIKIVTDHFRHAGGADGDYLGLVQAEGIGHAVDHVVKAAEHRSVFGH